MSNFDKLPKLRRVSLRLPFFPTLGPSSSRLEVIKIEVFSLETDLKEYSNYVNSVPLSSILKSDLIRKAKRISVNCILELDCRLKGMHDEILT